MMMEFRDLGHMNYRDAWALQQELQSGIIAAKQRQQEQTPAYVLFVEHPPVFTLGRFGNEANLLADAARLQAGNAEVIKVDRGGDITFHGPGQLVVYPIIDLEAYKLGLKDYVHLLEQVILETIAVYGIKGERLEKATGVWLDKDSVRARKICAMGVKCSHFVTMHGLALNINTDLSYFNLINPCGFVDKGVTSIEKETGRKIDFGEVTRIVEANFKTAFAQ